MRDWGGETNYGPDNSQAMDFLAGHSCSLFLSLSISVFPNLNLSVSDLRELRRRGSKNPRLWIVFIN